MRDAKVGAQGKNLEAEAKAETMEGHCSLTRSCGLFSLLSYIPQDHLLRSGTTHSGLGPPTLIISQDATPQACLEAI